MGESSHKKWPKLCCSILINCMNLEHNSSKTSKYISKPLTSRQYFIYCIRQTILRNLNRNSVEYQRARRRIQNNMDASRYVSPELSNFAKFQIPLQRQSPRSLNVL